jgi:hypothetical protein
MEVLAVTIWANLITFANAKAAIQRFLLRGARESLFAVPGVTEDVVDSEYQISGEER